MKAKLFFTSLFVCILQILYGQDFKPGETSSGYSFDKNTSADLSTGLFYYKVPLFELTSGGFSLPVSLNYVGKGVLADDFPGQIGYNWSLQAGGVVSRVVRGGIPDDAENGLARNRFVHDVKRVSMHELDGESDIFTLNLNGRTLNFILDQGFVVRDLERSGVRISCLRDEKITGWKVTDENGIQYIYKEQEIFRNRSHETAVSFNNTECKEYVSAWFISQMIPPGDDTIRFVYGGSPGDSTPDTDRRACLRSGLQVYHYGFPLYEFTSNFEPYRHLFNQALEEAKSYLSRAGMGLQQEIANVNNKFLRNYDVWSKNLVQVLQNKLIYQNRIMGVLTDMKGFADVNRQVVLLLDNLTDECQRMGVSGAVYELKRAKNYLKRTLTESTRVSAKTLNNTFYYELKTPVLKRIITSDKEAELIYNKVSASEGHTAHKLTRIVLRDCYDNTLLDFRFGRNNSDCLKVIETCSPEGKRINRQQFSYYQEESYPQGTDLWGHWASKNIQPSDEGYDHTYVKRFSLKNIKLSTGGEIDIDYRPNLIRTGVTSVRPAGGISIWKIILKSDADHRDTLEYLYPEHARCVYKNFTNRDTLSYAASSGQSSFKDIVMKPRIDFQGNACINTGNRGLYYDYVLEKRSGKGSRAWWFYVPSPSNTHNDKKFPYSLCGKMLGTAVYDLQGNLLQLIKNKYLTTHDSPSVDSGFLSFFDCKVASQGGNDQLKPYEYCMDASRLENYYRNQPDVVTYQDRESTHVLIPYQHIYKLNIEPRTRIEIPDRLYTLYFRCSTVLGEEKVYDFSGSGVRGPSADDLKRTIPAGTYLKQHITYKYDNSEQLFPTRIIRHLSNGDEELVLRRTPQNMENADRVIDKMRNYNILSPVIKQQVFLKKRNTNNYVLVDEQVDTYLDTLTPAGKTVFLPARRYRYSHSEGVAAVPETSSMDRVLFSQPIGKYRQEQEYSYRFFRRYFLAVESESLSSTSAICYDQGRENRILCAENSKKQWIDAVDPFRVKSSSSVSGKEDVRGKNLPVKLEVFPGGDHRYFRAFLYVLPERERVQVNYTAKKTGSSDVHVGKTFTVAPGKWTLLSLDVDLPAGGVNSLSVQLPDCKVAIATLTPRDVDFEAMSYDAEGKLFCKYNQNGQLQRYGYDSFKQVSEIRDQENRIVKQCYTNF